MAIHEDSDGTYGSPRVHRELRRQGHEVGKARVRRIMRQAGIEGRHKRRWRKTTFADRPFLVIAEVLGTHPNDANIVAEARWATSNSAQADAS